MITSAPMLELQNLWKLYRGIPSIQEVNLTISAGEVVGYLGPNGAGKSTTVKIITGVLEPTQGRVLFHGRDIREDIVGFRTLLGYVPEEAHVYTYLSALEYLQLVGRLRGMGEALIELKANRAPEDSLSRILAPFAYLRVLEGHEAAGSHRSSPHA